MNKTCKNHKLSSVEDCSNPKNNRKNPNGFLSKETSGLACKKTSSMHRSITTDNRNRAGFIDMI